MLTSLLSSSLGGSSVLKRGPNPIRQLQLACTKEGLDAPSIFGEDDEEEVKEVTMVGADVSASGSEVATVVGELRAGTEHFCGETLTSISVFCRIRFRTSRVGEIVMK